MILTSSFVIGSAVGALSTYIYKDDEAKEKVSGTALKLKSGILGLFKKKEEVSEELVASTETVLEPAVEVTEIVKEAAAESASEVTEVVKETVVADDKSTVKTTSSAKSTKA
ncbi:hypothetical protein [Leucothrix arctica]|uniref:YtxH domain-containing protein n=1 Tax=Leucothrix arctica TaxID=1481894 RepID=A0A317CG76_9GAMM|nr:hypothetical protein [Leucothrix arctica]PWQ97161.1 hypothetical protein DKT75_07550 [Leucothrix arctica]